MTGSRPHLTLEHFEGPLDLLLALVRKNRFDIRELPIAEVTRQYLAYLHEAETLDLDLGSEFAYMAATLIQIKSRSLLPDDPELTARDSHDPKQKLIRQLLDREQVRQAAGFLQQRLEQNQAAWTHPSSVQEFQETALDPDDSPDPGTLSVLDVARLARQALEAARTHRLLDLSSPLVTVEEMIAWLEERLRAGTADQPLPADPLFAEQAMLPRQTALFLAMLELAKTQHLGLEQAEAFAPLFLCPSMVPASAPSSP